MRLMTGRLVGILLVGLLLSGTTALAWIQDVTSGPGQGSAVAVDGDGDVLTVGRDPGGLYVARFDGPTGALVWSANPGDPAGGTLDALVVASNGDAIAAGRVPPLADDGWAVRLSAATGAEAWRFDLVSPASDAITAAAVDAADDVFLAAYSGGVAFIVVKLDGTSGAQLWRHDVAGVTPGAPFDVAVTPSGDVVAVGLVNVEQFFVISLDGATGAEQWRFVEGPPEPSLDDSLARRVAIDAAGDVVVGGRIHSIVPADPNTRVVKLDGDTGAELWRYAPDDGTTVFSVALDSAGDVIANDGFETVKLDGAGGAVLWSRALFPGPERVRITSTDDVILSGDGRIYHWSGATGAPIWSLTLGVPVFAVTTGPAIALDAADNVALAEQYTAGSISDRLAGKVLVLRESGTPLQQKLIVKSKDKRIVASGVGGFGDPTIGGATLVLSNPTSGETVTYPLPAAGWAPRSAKGPAGAAYQYKDPQNLLGPCRSASIRGGKKVTVVCSTTTPTFTLDEATQGSLAVRLTVGSGIAGEGFRYCFSFGAGSILDDRPQLFKAKNAPAPDGCT